ncbi:hypothetical protein JL720_9343 [Aureococcus anophagefferens]|nr:hypothetical protein JL720_9343 [Aureococcus anophagefferens]
MSRGESAAVKRLIKSILGAPTHYEVLGVDEDASAEDIGREYRDLARTVHPDKGGNAAAFKKLANAKEVLCDQNARMAYDLELREAREPAPKKPAAKTKAKPAAKAPAAKAKKKAPAAKAKKKAPAPASPRRGRSPRRRSPQPSARRRRRTPEPSAPMPYKGPCTCAIKATERYPITATARLLKCPAGDTDRHGCACPELRQTLQGTAPCRFGGDHACVCATKAASMFVAGKSTRVCRAAVHECSCLFDGQALCKAAAHACTCVEDSVAKCRAKKHACSCASSKDPASCLATGKHACACDALCDTFFGKQSSCRARAPCVCRAGRRLPRTTATGAAALRRCDRGGSAPAGYASALRIRGDALRRREPAPRVWRRGFFDALRRRRKRSSVRRRRVDRGGSAPAGYASALRIRGDAFGGASQAPAFGGAGAASSTVFGGGGLPFGGGGGTFGTGGPASSSSAPFGGGVGGSVFAGPSRPKAAAPKGSLNPDHCTASPAELQNLAAHVIELCGAERTGSIMVSNLAPAFKKAYGKDLPLYGVTMKVLLQMLPGVVVGGDWPGAYVSRAAAAAAHPKAGAPKKKKAVSPKPPGVAAEAGAGLAARRLERRAPKLSLNPKNCHASPAQLQALAGQVLELCDAADSGSIFASGLPAAFKKVHGVPLPLYGVEKMKVLLEILTLYGVAVNGDWPGAYVSRAAVHPKAAAAPPRGLPSEHRDDDDKRFDEDTELAMRETAENLPLAPGQPWQAEAPFSKRNSEDCSAHSEAEICREVDHASAALQSNSPQSSTRSVDDVGDGHTEYVTSVCFAGNERGLSASRDCTAKLWDLANGVCIHTLEGHTDRVTAVCAYGGEKGCAITASKDKTAKVWNLVTGECVLTLEEHHTQAVESVCVTPDGTRLVTGSRDRTAKVWDLETGICVATLSGHAKAVSSVCVTHDARLAVTASEDFKAKIWEVATERRKSRAHREP